MNVRGDVSIDGVFIIEVESLLHMTLGDFGVSSLSMLYVSIDVTRFKFPKMFQLLSIPGKTERRALV